MRSCVLISLAALLSVGCRAETDKGGTKLPPVEILNVSHDPTRELYQEINAAFAVAYEKEHGRAVTVKQSHAASGSQARAIVDGLAADVATLSIWSDTEQLRKNGLIPEKWDERLPNRSLPYTSTVVFVVRKGNPKALHDWPDLLKEQVEVITPSPKTSGNGKLSFLAAWGHGLKKRGSPAAARAFVTDLYKHVPVLDQGARGATTTFSQRQIGDVHLAIENEARLEVAESNGALEIVYPPLSIVHEPHVTLVDKRVDEHGTREVAEAYLQFLYSKEAQEIMARNHFRPSDPEIFEKHREQFPTIETFPLTDIAADWSEAQKTYFAEGGVFDEVYSPRN